MTPKQDAGLFSREEAAIATGCPLRNPENQALVLSRNTEGNLVVRVLVPFVTVSTTLALGNPAGIPALAIQRFGRLLPEGHPVSWRQFGAAIMDYYRIMMVRGLERDLQAVPIAMVLMEARQRRAFTLVPPLAEAIQKFERAVDEALVEAHFRTRALSREDQQFVFENAVRKQRQMLEAA